MESRVAGRGILFSFLCLRTAPSENISYRNIMAKRGSFLSNVPFITEIYAIFPQHGKGVQYFQNKQSISAFPFSTTKAIQMIFSAPDLQSHIIAYKNLNFFTLININISYIFKLI